MKYSFLIVTLLSLISPLVVLGAGPVIRSGDTVTVESSQVLEGDFYAVGESITLSGEALRDVYAAGGMITINAPVKEDLTVLGGTVHVHGKVGDDVRVVGGEVIIAEPIADDLVVIGGKVTVLSTASVGGDLIFVSGDVTVDGRVEGTVYGMGENVRIDSYVGGDVDVDTHGKLTLGDRAEIGGNITYTSPSELVRAQNAVVMGTISRSEEPVYGDGEEGNPYMFLVVNLLIFAFSGLSFFFVLRARTERLMGVLMEGYGRFGLIGLGMFFALPLLSVILLVSGIGSIVGITLLFFYVVLLFASFMCIPIVFGTLAQKVTRLGEKITAFTVLLGACLMLLVLLIPVLGFFLIFLTFLVSLGLLCNEVYHYLRRG